MNLINGFVGAIILSATGLTIDVASAASTNKAEWTVMVFMNAKNNLEPDAIANFEEMESIGSAANVNILVEMGRPKVHETEDAGNWSGVLRFKVAKGQEPIPANAIVDLRDKSPLVSDLGSPEAFQDFLDWSIRNYPARRYMLIVWNHGQGWRFQTAKSFVIDSSADSGSGVSVAELGVTRPSAPSLGGFKAVSFDADTGHYLFNSDIQKAVEKISTRLGKKIDILGFDACLMSMFETAYAFRNSVDLLIGSQELEPAAGWDYVPFMRLLASKPSSSPLSVSSKILSGYRIRFGDVHKTTLSLIDESRVTVAAAAISKFAKLLTDGMDKERGRIGDVRNVMGTYGSADGLKTSIDFITFADGYSRVAGAGAEKDAAVAASKAVKAMIVDNYASSKAKGKLGSKGIAIYFPATKKAFDEDIYHDGYRKSNTDHPVEFVEKELWADFVSKYIGL